MASILKAVTLLEALKDLVLISAGTATLTSAATSTVNVGLAKIDLIITSMESTSASAPEDVNLTGVESSTDKSIDLAASGSDGTSVVHYLVLGQGAR